MNAVSLLEMRGLRRTPVIRQAEAAECGLACVAMVASYHGYKADLATLRRRFSISLKGAKLATLMKIADELGFNARGLRGDLDDLHDLALPAILHWNLSHFVVLTGIDRRLGKRVYRINDPAHGEITLTRDEVSKHFTGVVLDLRPSERFQPKRAAPTLKLSQLWSRATGLKRIIVQVGLLSLVLQLVALATPFYMQTAIDSALPAFDTDLLAVLAAGFAGLVLVQLATGWLRAWVLLGLGTQLGYQVVVNLFRHMMRLPLPWFERRHVGDVISRFGSTTPIVTMLTQGLMAAVLDGVMAIATLGLMLVYSPKLAGIAVVALLLYLAMRLSFLRMLRALNVSAITANAAEQSSLIESVRGILGVKTFGQEANRQRIWQNRKTEAVNAQIKTGRVGAGFDAVQTAIFGFENVLFVYLAVGMAMKAELTIGMVFAYQAYKQQFLGAGTRLVEAVLNWQLNSVHLARIADIALAPPETGAVGTGVERSPLTGRIELRGVRFSYGVGEPEVLKGIDLIVEAGETLTITGPSGGGKTTLMKIMLGLIEPAAGEVLVDGIPLATYGKAAYRHQIGAVMQDDLLYAGSIAENIALFDPEIDMDRVRRVAAAAAIAPEIDRMPMGYESLVGDMGSSLSGGQRQRVLIARALYRTPRYVFADEVTASLDPDNHARIGDALAGVAATKIIVTHRAFARAEGRLLFVQDGRVEEGRLNPEPPIKRQDSMIKSDWTETVSNMRELSIEEIHQVSGGGKNGDGGASGFASSLFFSGASGNGFSGYGNFVGFSGGALTSGSYQFTDAQFISSNTISYVNDQGHTVTGTIEPIGNQGYSFDFSRDGIRDTATGVAALAGTIIGVIALPVEIPVAAVAGLSFLGGAAAGAFFGLALREFQQRNNNPEQ